MTDRHATCLLPACGLILAICSATLQAEYIFYVGSGSLQPNENLLFNEPGLLDSGTTVEGITNQTGTIFELTSNDNPQETLTTPSAGAARVEAEDGSFTSIILSPQDSDLYFRQLEFNVNVLNGESGTFSLTVVDQNGVPHQDDFDPNTIAQGSNYFSVDAQGGWLIREAILTASDSIIQDIRQIRVDGIVPEPSALALALLAGVGLLGWRRH